MGASLPSADREAMQPARAEAVTTRSLWAEAFRVERRGIDVRAGLAGGLATSVPVVLGVALDAPEIGATACFGGLNTALAIPRSDLRDRLGWGAGTTLACCASVALATAVQDSVAAFVVACMLVVGLAAFLRTFGHTGALSGFVIAAIYVIMGGIPVAPLDVGERVLWFALGSFAGLVLMVAARARDAPPRSPTAAPLATVLVRGGRQLRAAIARDELLRAHALRLSVIVGGATLLVRLLDLEHGYWVPLTVLAVLQPDEHASSVRAVQRATGTLVGTALIAALTVATGAEWLLIAGQALAAFWLFAVLQRGYFWLVVLLTPTALLTLNAIDYRGADDALQRAGWSAFGILLGLAVAELCWRLAPHVPQPREPASAAPPP